MFARNKFNIKKNYSYALAAVMASDISLTDKLTVKISEQSLTKEQLLKLEYYGFDTYFYGVSTQTMTATITVDQIDALAELPFLSTIDLGEPVTIDGTL